MRGCAHCILATVCRNAVRDFGYVPNRPATPVPDPESLGFCQKSFLASFLNRDDSNFIVDINCVFNSASIDTSLVALHGLVFEIWGSKGESEIFPTYVRLLFRLCHSSFYLDSYFPYLMNVILTSWVCSMSSDC